MPGTLRFLQPPITKSGPKLLKMSKTALPDDQQAVIYHGMGIPAPPRNVRKTIA